jgi:predicted nucleotidyltransferase
MAGCIRESINFITKKVQKVLQSGRKEHIEVSIEMYGSRANGLDIETSDTDLLIICNINAGVKDLMLEL